MSTARRLRLLCALVTVYAVLVLVGGIAAGATLILHERHIGATVDASGNYVLPRVTHPYVWAGAATITAAVVLATVLLLVAELVRMRANVVIEDRTPRRGAFGADGTGVVGVASAGGPGGAARGGAPAGRALPGPTAATVSPGASGVGYATAPGGYGSYPGAGNGVTPGAVGVDPTGRQRRSAGQRRASMRNGRRVVVLTDSEKAVLASTPPPSTAEGWYPDPLGDADLRRWTGAQWTGEQQSIALPPQ